MHIGAARLRRQALLVAAATLIIPLCVGVTVATRWGDLAGDDFYTTISQVIATLFLAVAFQLFARAPTERRPYEAGTVPVLVLVGWTGFFACVRALAGDATSGTAGLAAAGVVATEVLASLALYDRVVSSSRDSAPSAAALWLVVGFLVAPVSVVIVV